ncbi:MAG: hypothetical protein Ct9H300mP1_20660 [Planctomycetaceae bacterium]|nr:MAG: hypothetical protein Ct9H300mP1_20660 [Planctomycetaceae bacterium]
MAARTKAVQVWGSPGGSALAPRASHQVITAVPTPSMGTKAID